MILARLRGQILGLVLLLLIGSTGYRYLEGWSWFDGVWMVVISLTTIGYSEVKPMSLPGRVFTLALITVGFGIATWAFTSITRYVVEGGLQQDLTLRRRRRRMKHLSNHVIVVGYGRLGREVAHELASRGTPVCVLDLDESVSEDLPDGVLFLCGDGPHDETLKQAGIERARGIAIATPSSATNVYITLAARQLVPGLAIVTRIDDVDAESKARRAGADRLVTPYGAGGSRMAQAILHLESSDFLERMVTRHHQALDLQDVLVGEKATRWHGTLAGLDLRRRAEVLVVAIRREDGTFLTAPSPGTRVGPGDVLVVVGSPEAVAGFSRDLS